MNLTDYIDKNGRQLAIGNTVSFKDRKDVVWSGTIAALTKIMGQTVLVIKLGEASAHKHPNEVEFVKE